MLKDITSPLRVWVGTNILVPINKAVVPAITKIQQSYKDLTESPKKASVRSRDSLTRNLEFENFQKEMLKGDRRGKKRRTTVSPLPSSKDANASPKKGT